MADMEAQQKEDVESKLQPGDQRWGKEERGERARGSKKGMVENGEVEG